MDISLKKLRYFIAVAETGKVSQAAVDLNISQSSVTTGIRELEANLGMPLFLRRAQGMTLTYEGRRFLQRARHALTAVEDAFNIPRRPERLVGHVRVATSYTVVGYFLPAHLARFQRRYPDIQLELVEASRNDIEAGLEEGRYEMAVMLTSNLEDVEHLHHRTLIHSPRRLWVASGHPLLSRESVAFADLVAEPYIMLTVDECKLSSLRYWSAAGQSPSILFETSSVESVRSMVANGLGITVLSDMVYRPWSLEGRKVETITLSNPVASMDVGLAWTALTMGNPAARILHDFLLMSVAGEAPRQAV
ncbi:LysR family transcriptional regulator [Phytohalomonas tamaricis]|uniref:LysR family transcriptional regulator n=1 Tax=Phytohalomonas tamaricis TaxID=2081032 RepID=UPI00131A12B8|nr:LysR family transcriptional regulator [Phytohalomonas tamaricis]